MVRIVLQENVGDAGVCEKIIIITTSLLHKWGGGKLVWKSKTHQYWGHYTVKSDVQLYKYVEGHGLMPVSSWEQSIPACTPRKGINYITLTVWPLMLLTIGVAITDGLQQCREHSIYQVSGVLCI